MSHNLLCRLELQQTWLVALQVKYLTKQAQAQHLLLQTAQLVRF
jgi:hypothetical protein